MSSIIRRRAAQSNHKINKSISGFRGTAVLPTHTTIASRKGTSGAFRSTVALIAFVCSVISFVFWLYLKGGSGRIDREIQQLEEVHKEHSKSDSLTRSPTVIRISASDHTNLTQFFPCVNDAFMPGSTSEIDKFLPSHREKSRIPNFTSLPCAPPNKNLCFRGVYDAFDNFLNEIHDGESVSEHLKSRISGLLESLILHPQNPLTPELLELDSSTKTPLLEASLHRKMIYYPTSDAKGEDASNYRMLHGDYFESALYVYTAILYDEPSNDLIGGETALIDLTKDTKNKKITFGMRRNNETAASGEDIELTSGVIVEPKRGRLVLFSAGGENFHAPMEVKRGERPTYHIWFRCKARGLKGSSTKRHLTTSELRQLMHDRGDI